MDPVLSFFCDSMLIYAGPDACSYFFLSTVIYRELKRIALSSGTADVRRVICLYAPVDKDRLFWKPIEPLAQADFVVLNTTRNDLIVPRLPQLLSQRGRFLVVGDDATFVSTFLGKEYHLEQRSLHSWRMTRRMMDYSVLSSE